MNALQVAPTPDQATPLTEDQVYDTVIGPRRGYVHGLGHGQDPRPYASLSEFDNVESRRYAREAERRAEEAERRAEDAHRRLEESERRTDEKMEAMKEQMQAEMQAQMRTQMQDFIAQFQGANMVSISYCLKDLFCYVNGIFVDG